MKRSYRLHAGGGHVTYAGGETRGSMGSARTGRQVDVESGRYGDADKWQGAVLRGDYLGDDGYRELFVSTLREAPLASEDLRLFRGRCLAPGEERSFGPPQCNEACAGRYNRKGEPVWYLCSSIAGVVAEVETDEARVLHVAEFAVPVSNLRVVDLVARADSFAQMAFLLAERDDDWNAFSHLLAEIVSSEFGGMMVPGVRHTPRRYSNVVLFDREPHWEDWLVGVTVP